MSSTASGGLLLLLPPLLLLSFSFFLLHGCVAQHRTVAVVRFLGHHPLQPRLPHARLQVKGVVLVAPAAA